MVAHPTDHDHDPCWAHVAADCRHVADHRAAPDDQTTDPQASVVAHPPGHDHDPCWARVAVGLRHGLQTDLPGGRQGVAPGRNFLGLKGLGGCGGYPEP